jgi:hypothetical protein
MRKELNQNITVKIGIIDLSDIPQEFQDEYDVYEPIKPDVAKPDINDITPEGYDTYWQLNCYFPRMVYYIPLKW